jgi:hypothetical protein
VVTKLNQKSIQPYSTLVKQGKVVRDERDAWSEHQPSADRHERSILIGLRRREEPGILTIPPRVCPVPEQTSAQAAAGEHEQQGDHRQQKNRLAMLPPHP